MNREEVLRWLEVVARGDGYELNRDREELASIVEILARNIEEYGAPYCPCDLPGRDGARICPCPQRHEEIRATGSCHCGLFLSPPGERDKSPRGEGEGGARFGVG